MTEIKHVKPIHKVTFKPERIISGGNYGADLGALIGAKKCGIATGGWAPAGFEADGGIASTPTTNRVKLSEAYGLKEFKDGGYKARDQANVDEADLLLAFRLDEPRSGKGTDQTIAYALSGKYEHIPNVRSSVLSFVTFKEAADKPFPPEIRRERPNAKPISAIIVWDLHTMPEDDYYHFVDYVFQLIQTVRPRTLMVSGPTEKKAPGFQAKVTWFIEHLFSDGEKSTEAPAPPSTPAEEEGSDWMDLEPITSAATAPSVALCKSCGYRHISKADCDVKREPEKNLADDGKQAPRLRLVDLTGESHPMIYPSDKNADEAAEHFKMYGRRLVHARVEQNEDGVFYAIPTATACP